MNQNLVKALDEQGRISTNQNLVKALDEHGRISANQNLVKALNEQGCISISMNQESFLEMSKNDHIRKRMTINFW
jgi:cell fate (sporulation/competence/biofilm development) regulator YmcA (YheA/YmcA/DUF963 family)